jgi:hypothetical protein
MFDPERDAETRRWPFWARLAALFVFTAAAAALVAPSVMAYTIEDTKSCVAILDGWHRERRALSDDEFERMMELFPAIPSPTEAPTPEEVARIKAEIATARQSPLAQQFEAYDAWRQGGGACVPEGRHRLIFSGFGLGGVALVAGASLALVAVRRRTRNTRPEGRVLTTRGRQSV